MNEEKDEGEKLSLKTVPLLRDSFYFYVSRTRTTRVVPSSSASL